MATIRNQFRGMFATSIILLLVLCSLAIWLWARYIIRQQAQALIRRDVKRLATEIAWQPQLGAFELRPSGNAAPYAITSNFWQVTDATGRIIWKSDTWKGYTGTIPFTDLERATPVFEITVPNGKSSMLASARDVTVDERSSRTTMLAEFPEAVRAALERLAPTHEVVATEIEYADEQFHYEVILRKGEELLELELSELGIPIEEAHHRVPTSLPPAVRETFERTHPDTRIASFDWRASQGYLQFLVTGESAGGERYREGISSTGQLIPLFFPADGKPLGKFRIIVGDEQGWRRGLLGELGWILAGVCGSGFIAAWFLSLWLAERALQPMGSLARKARLIDERRLSDRLSGGRADDEIGILVQAINGMLDRIEKAFERQRRFARDASHELRSPLTGLLAQIEVARARLPKSSDALPCLDSALERGQRLRDLIGKLLLLARQESDQPVSMRDDVDMDECLANVVADFPDALRERIRMQPGHREGDRLLRGNEELLHAMFRNIIDNALKFSSPRDPVTVSCEADAGGIRVEVADRGAGIPPAAREQVFEPFVRLRQVSQVEGAGLGLSIVKWIADLHQAELRIDSGNGAGTRVSVRLPASVELPD